MRGKFIRYMHDPKDLLSLIDNRIGAIFEDSKGIFWVSTAKDGLHTMDRAKGKFERHLYDPAHPERLSGPPRIKEIGLDLTLFFIREDGAGAIWIGSSGGWITRYDPTTKKSTHYDSINDDAQAAQSTSGAFTSREGVLWLTTWSGNIYRVDPLQSTIPHFSTGSIIHAIHEDASGALWLGTFGDGLVRTDRKGSMERFSSGSLGLSNLDNYWVPAIYGEDDSTLCIGSVNSLNHYNTKTKKFTRYSNIPQNQASLSKGAIIAISADQPGSLWIATTGGLDRFEIKSGVFRHYRNNPKDSNSLTQVAAK